MKRLLIPAAMLFLFSCNNKNDEGNFTLTGELKGATDQKIYLEELFFSQKDPEVLDTGEVKGGKFTVSALSKEAGLFRLRLEKGEAAYMFINDGAKINFTGDVNNPDISGWSFSGPSNSSFKKLLMQMDSAKKMINSTYATLMQLQQSNASPTDSVVMALDSKFNAEKEALTIYCFKYADTAANPMVALFAATMAPVEINKFQLPVEKLSQRFPKHNGIASAVSFIKTEIARQQVQNQPPTTAVGVGAMAPVLTMNDTNGNPFAWSQLKGKYVLIDFWASWCGPCREENPNVVSAYNQFKSKNFTVLGVSLDDDKANWLKAIADDKLEWQHISDLKKWSSPAVDLYGFDGIPYNVLIDPSGKIIATGLRGNELHTKLASLLK